MFSIISKTVAVSASPPASTFDIAVSKNTFVTRSCGSTGSDAFFTILAETSILFAAPASSIRSDSDLILSA